jgi:hypothetical protein
MVKADAAETDKRPTVTTITLRAPPTGYVVTVAVLVTLAQPKLPPPQARARHMACARRRLDGWRKLGAPSMRSQPSPATPAFEK